MATTQSAHGMVEVSQTTIQRRMQGKQTVRGLTWLPAKRKPAPKPKVAEDVRETIDALVAPVVALLKARLCKRPRNPRFNWPADLFTRWHREALYLVVVMRTPHGRPPTFEMHAARMEHAGKSKFNLAVPMRRGWSTILKNATPKECLKEISEIVWL
jgi:hypothetical protein